MIHPITLLNDNEKIWNKICLKCENQDKTPKQAGTELGQAQLKLGLEFTLIFCRFGYSTFVFMGLIESIWFGMFCFLQFKNFAL